MDTEQRVRRKIKAQIVYNENIVIFGPESARDRYKRTTKGQETARRAAERRRTWDKIVNLVEKEGKS